MNSILTLRADYDSQEIQTLNVSARGTREADRIADQYAQSNGFKYWDIQYQRYAFNAPRLVRGKRGLYIDRDLTNETKRGYW